MGQGDKVRTRRLLLPDLSNQAYKASASHPMLSSEGVFTGGLYGFICAVAKAIQVTGATNICLTHDRKPYIRAISYPEYKALRKTTKDPVLVECVETTILQVEELCEVVGFPRWSVHGFESDDLIAHAVTNNRYRFEKITAMSNDSDLFQLFKHDCFEVYKGKAGIYDKGDFYKEFGHATPEDFVLMLSMAGTHNDVEGVKGIGLITAKKILMDNTKYTSFYKQHSNIIERNLGLIRLPHKEFPRSEQMPLPTCKYNERNLIRFLSKYNIKLERWVSEAFERVGA